MGGGGHGYRYVHGYWTLLSKSIQVGIPYLCHYIIQLCCILSDWVFPVVAFGVTACEEALQ